MIPSWKLKNSTFRKSATTEITAEAAEVGATGAQSKGLLTPFQTLAKKSTWRELTINSHLNKS